MLGRTDAAGAIRVPAASDPLRVLLIKNGGVLLARLPIVPGLVPELTAEIPDDDPRLEAEGFITGMRENLVDLVTRRQILFVRARKHIEAGELDKAAELVDELRGLQTRTEFLRDLDRRQEKLDTDNIRGGKKIDKLFADLRTLLERFLDPAPIEKISRDLVNARSGKSKAAESPAAKAQ